MLFDKFLLIYIKLYLHFCKRIWIFRIVLTCVQYYFKMHSTHFIIHFIQHSCIINQSTKTASFAKDCQRSSSRMKPPAMFHIHGHLHCRQRNPRFAPAFCSLQLGKSHLGLWGPNTFLGWTWAMPWRWQNPSLVHVRHCWLCKPGKPQSRIKWLGLS